MKTFQITLSEAQMNNMFVCLDGELKRRGLESLEAVVDLHNILMDAQRNPLNTEPKSDEDKKGR